VVLPLVSAFHLAAGGWRLKLQISRWVGSSTFVGTIAAQTSGPKVRIGHAVTLRVDRRTVCAPLRCGLMRSELPFTADVDGSFETNTHGGPIAFRARHVIIGP
jgi:hypothetical protein